MTSEVFLQHRIKMVEDLWESVLLQECGQDLVDLLNQLLSLCSPEGQAENSFEESEALKIVEKLELNEAVRAARAFALYFQIINIVEQHYEQRDQQKLYRAAQESRSDTDRSKGYWAIEAAAQENPYSSNSRESDRAGSGDRPVPSQHPDSRQGVGTFQWLFPRLKALNVPPQQIQKLVDQLEVWLVFTAHPTEIVRHTIRGKQRRISNILRDLDHLERVPAGSIAPWESQTLSDRLTEEIRLWWRTDELHQFKPTVLDEVDYTLHYFQEVLFDAMP